MSDKPSALSDVLRSFTYELAGAFSLLIVAWIRKIFRKKVVQQLEEEVMEKVVVDGKEVDVKVEIKEGKVMLIADYAGHGGSAKVEAAVSVDYLLDKIAEKIPGQVDDAVFGVLKQALKLV